jgi:flagellar biosynthesis/type III secretory pathway protein FliH
MLQKGAIELAEKQGLERGIEKGIEKGMEIGMKKGREDAQRFIARQLIGFLDAATIAAKTGLTVDEVRELESE